MHGPEFDTWITTFLQVLQSKDRGHTCLSHLRQLLVLTSVTKYNRKYVKPVSTCVTVSCFILSLSSNVFRALRSIVLEPEQGPVKLRLLAAAILRELSPLQKNLIRDFNPPTDAANIPYVLPVLLSQVS